MGGTGRDILSNYFRAEGVPSNDGSLTNMDIYVGLKRYRPWRLQFAERYVYLIYNNFSTETTTAILDEMVAEMEPEMERHIKRWGYPNTPKSVSDWKSYIAKIYDFLEGRPQKALDQLQRYFGLSDSQMQEFTDKAIAARDANN